MDQVLNSQVNYITLDFIDSKRIQVYEGMKNKLVIIDTTRSWLHAVSQQETYSSCNNQKFPTGGPLQKICIQLIKLANVDSGQIQNNHLDLSNHLFIQRRKFISACKHRFQCSVLCVGILLSFFGAQIGSTLLVQFSSRASNALSFVFDVFLPNSQHCFNSKPSHPSPSPPPPTNNGNNVLCYVTSEKLLQLGGTLLHFKSLSHPIIRKGYAFSFTKMNIHSSIPLSLHCSNVLSVCLSQS